jgi:hypothetical protein
VQSADVASLFDLVAPGFCLCHVFSVVAIKFKQMPRHESSWRWQ